MNAEKLKKILADHKVWVESDYQTGKRADLNGADLRGAHLSLALLNGAHLNSANLRDANLHGAHLSGADLRCADLYGAHLSLADLYKADLRNADLTGADLHGAYLNRADLTGAHFELEIKTVNSFSNTIFSEAAIPWVILHPRWSEYADSVKFV